MSIVDTSTPDNLPTEVLKASSPMFNTLAASMSFFNSCLTPNKDLFAFIYASTISLGSIGPPFKVLVVNNFLDCLTPFDNPLL